jgi:outer membrane biosynthesis protein TonB
MAARAPSPAILGAVLLHVGVAGLFLLPRAEREEITPIINSVPVSIVSSQVIEAAAADKPAEELVTEDAATAPPETTAPEPAPPEPTPPVPAPPAPRPAPTPRPTPPRPTPPRPAPPTPTPPRPTPPRPTPPRPTPPRPAPTQPTAPLDLDALAGPRRPAPAPGPRAPTGQQGTGRAAQAAGPQIAGAILQQASRNWTILCDIPGGADMRVTMDVTLGQDGSITRGPTLVNPSNDPAWRAQADGALRAMRQTAPFDVPQGFPGGSFRPTFTTARECRNR